MNVWLVGVPTTVGGANTESYHTARLWQKAGMVVDCLYFTKCKAAQPAPTNPFFTRLEADGVRFHPTEAGKLSEVPGLAGSIVVGFCNSQLMNNWKEFHDLGCKIVWVPCMNHMVPHEVKAIAIAPPHAVVFQSDYQYKTLHEDHAMFGCKRLVKIHGAFDPTRFQPTGEKRTGTFVVGRIARPNRTKWNPELWNILSAARDRSETTINAMALGWSEELVDLCGAPPSWARCFLPDQLPVELFLNQCHALICPNYTAVENWPRVGLEAMSAGVSLIVDDAGGWREMCGDAAIYCKTPQEYVDAVVKLSEDEGLRKAKIAKGKDRVRAVADPDAISEKWTSLFQKLQ